MNRDIIQVEGPTESAIVGGGGLAGAERTARETFNWTPSMRSPDQIINIAKPLADARGRDMSMNDGYAHGAVATHKDSIVGAQYRLNAEPDLRVLRSSGIKAFDEKWLEEFVDHVEGRFELLANSEACYLDAYGRMTLTEQVRLVVGGFVVMGEGTAAVGWNRSSGRPIRTEMQLFAPARLSNPDGKPDDRNMRRGVHLDDKGRVLGYWVRQAHPTETYDNKSYQWDYIPAQKPWGRKQFVHLYEPMEVGQSRGIADMVSALKHMKMTKHFSELTLQNAVINASYAAAIESELPPESVAAMMGQSSGAQNYLTAIGSYMSALQAYLEGSENIKIDGAKVAHLFPGTKLNFKPMGTPGGVGTDFEKSLLRHTAAPLGLSYEEFARDFTGVSYSGGKLATSITERFMRARKKFAADKYASAVYGLALEEMIGRGDVPLPRGVSREHFYVPLMREAYSRCSWIGAGVGEIDPLKEVQAAILRIKSGLSTYRRECARFGEDYREVFAQAARENGLQERLKLSFSLEPSRPNKQGEGEKQENDGAKDKAEDE